GAGTMGAGIAEVAARAGHRVRLHDTRADAAAAALDGLRRRVDRDVVRGRLDAGQAADLLGRVEVAAALDDLAGCALVVEAVVETGFRGEPGGPTVLRRGAAAGRARRRLGGDDRRRPARGRGLPDGAVPADGPRRPGRQPGRVDIGVGADLPRPPLRPDAVP